MGNECIRILWGKEVSCYKISYQYSHEETEFNRVGSPDSLQCTKDWNQVSVE